MSVSVFSELIHEFRSVVEQRSGLRLEPLRPPASEQALDALERTLGRALPEALRDLYRVSTGRFLFSCHQVLFGDELIKINDDVRRMVPRWYGYDFEADGATVGAAPTEADEYLAFGWSDIGYVCIDTTESSGGRVNFIDALWYGRWLPLGHSIEAVLRWSVEVAHRTEAFQAVRPGHDDRFDAVISTAPVDLDTAAIITEIVGRYGGTPVNFLIQD
jgi:hypothetical protein